MNEKKELPPYTKDPRGPSREMPKGERCPDCRGRGEIMEKLKNQSGFKQESVACPRCGGEGTL